MLPCTGEHIPTLVAWGLRSLLCPLGDPLSCTDGDLTGVGDIPAGRGLLVLPLPALWCCGLPRGGVRFWAVGGMIGAGP